mmetsp:Transcript_28218/g.76481  ORF Transcript_28218/g.76481 Transcript_28218/m.76481 type:complete len:282 (+) Transcript_28218:615-1460(+)
MSRMDLMPALTTTTGVWPSSVRSEETSMLISPLRWTPPMPPVTKVAIPARCASFMVDATVVAPHCAGSVLVLAPLPAEAAEAAAAAAAAPTMMGRSRVEHFCARPSSPALARSSNSLSEMPTRQTPFLTATVAGTTPFSSRICSTSLASSRFSGKGMPWATMVLSSAQTGRPSATARKTRSSTRKMLGSTGDSAEDCECECDCECDCECEYARRPSLRGTPGRSRPTCSRRRWRHWRHWRQRRTPLVIGLPENAICSRSWFGSISLRAIGMVTIAIFWCVL